MSSLCVSILYAAVLYLLGAVDCRGFAEEEEAFLARRSLKQQVVTSVTRVRVANFGGLSRQSNAILQEKELNGRINITSSMNDEPVLYGAYYLGPSEVAQINQTVASELPLIPAYEAKLAPLIVYPGRLLRGMSVLDTLSDKQPKRIPTVFAPFYSGYKFELLARQSPPGTTLQFSNMTVLVANATYETLATSGIMSYFSFGTSARMCITNSMFILQSCKGFQPNSFHMWCCTKRQCNIEYTEQAIQDLGYPMEDSLQVLTCHELQSSGTQESPKTKSGSGYGELPFPLERLA